MRGFTLIELLAVLMIIGILAAIGVPRYVITVENSKADEAQALLQTVYTGNRMYKINNPAANYCRDAVHGVNSCNTGPPSNLISRNYIQNLNNPVRPFTYYAANDGTASAYIACARRNGGGAPYDGWFYSVTAAGVVCAGGGAPPASGMGVCGGACP